MLNIYPKVWLLPKALKALSYIKNTHVFTFPVATTTSFPSFTIYVLLNVFAAALPFMKCFAYSFHYTQPYCCLSPVTHLTHYVYHHRFCNNPTKQQIQPPTTLLHSTRGVSGFFTHLSNVSSSSWFKSQAMYSKEASVMRGHHDKSKARSFCRFSAMSSTPSSVSLLQPDKLSTVRCGNECTATETQKQKEEAKVRRKVKCKMVGAEGRGAVEYS